MESTSQTLSTINMMISGAFSSALSIIEEGITDPRIKRHGGLMAMQIEVEGFSADLRINLNEALIEVSQDGKLLYSNRPFRVEDPAYAKQVISRLTSELGSIYEMGMLALLGKSAASCERSDPQ